MTTPEQPIQDDADDEIPRTPWTTRERLMLLALLSLLVHIPLYFSLRTAADHAERRVTLTNILAPKDEFTRVRLWQPPIVEHIPEDARIVETPAQEHIENAPPVETKNLSDKTTRTEKETRSELVAPPDKRKGNAEAPKPEKPSAVQSASSKSKDETTSSKPSNKIELAGGGQNLPQSDHGTRPKSSMKPEGAGGGTGNGLLLPSTSQSAALANLQALGGGEEYTSNDYLPGMDRGRKTLLNANQYRYADFFQRVKTQVEKHWRPSEAYLRRDPTGQAYGVKDRYTVLRVELDKSGKVSNITTWRQSGLDFMDEEAKRAFRAANPFLNPPLELVDEDGKIRFEFGFYFEITGGKYRFNWRRL